MLPAHFAVVWSGVFNFLGVMVSSGAVAYGIIALLPVELILQVGSSAGFAMVFALLIGAIVWNLGTWYLGLPASSSHTLIGSIIGVGLANQLMAVAGGASGVDWAQASKVGYSLLLSPLIGFCASALLLLTLKVVARSPELYQEPKGAAPPPGWIRGLLILTCTGVSFAHGSNDGQKVVAVDDGNGCVTPSAETVADNTYQPLSRPIFLYVSAAAAARGEASAFARFFVNSENARRVQAIGYVPLPTATLLSVGRRLDSRMTGSIFGGRGSVLGLTADTFQDEDRLQNALVR